MRADEVDQGDTHHSDDSDSLADVLGPAVDLAEGGFPVYAALRNAVHKVRDRYAQEWPTSAAIYLTNDQAPLEGTLHRNPDWARTLKGAIDASLKAASSGREAGIDAAIEYFYSGPVAAQAVKFSSNNAFLDDSGRAHAGLFTLDDFAYYGARYPALMMFAGVGQPGTLDAPGLHHPAFLPREEAVADVARAMLAGYVAACSIVLPGAAGPIPDHLPWPRAARRPAAEKRPRRRRGR